MPTRAATKLLPAESTAHKALIGRPNQTGAVRANREHHAPRINPSRLLNY